MALGKKPTRGGRRPQVCRKEEPTRKLKGGHKKSKAREKDVQTPGLLISRNLPTKPAFCDLPVKPGIAPTRYASPRFYRSLPVSPKAPAVQHTVANVEGVQLAPQSAAGRDSAPSSKDVDVPVTDCGAERAGDFSPGKNDPDLRNSEVPSVATYVSAINGEWQRGVDAFMNAARLCAEASERLTIAQKSMLIQGLPFGQTAFSKFVQIGSDARLHAPDIQRLLPPHYTTVYAVTLLTDQELSLAIAEKVICPDMKRDHLQKWRNSRREKVAVAPSPNDLESDTAIADQPTTPTKDAVQSGALPSTKRVDNRTMQEELAAAPKAAPTPEFVATAPVVAAPLTPARGEDDVPSFLDRRPLSAEDQRTFDGIMAALKSAPAVVRERVKAELIRSNA